jgi:two-component system cell cycle response regulator
MRILIADDDAMSRTLLQATLKRLGHDVIAVADGTAAIAALLAPDGPRLAILDWMMPGADGLEVCREIRDNSEAYVYIVLLTARDSAGDMVTGLEAGADDFLTKPFNAGELRARLRSGARVLDLLANLLEAQEALKVQATVDHLTGLWNRRMIMEQLDRELNRARHEQRSLTVAMVDVDRFKSINDTHGHAVGDMVLRTTASALKSQLRQYDFVGRYGGEEFLVLLPGCDSIAGQQVGERIRACVASQPTVVGNGSIAVTVSVGLAVTAVAGFAPGALIEAADAALYRAKANGRNRVEQYVAPLALEGAAASQSSKAAA